MYSGWNSPSLVIGSLYFFRRYFCWTRMSKFGGREPGPIFISQKRIARTVLFAAKNQLGFFLALSLVPPGGKQRSHEHRHHGEADQQRRHGVTPLAVLTLKPMRNMVRPEYATTTRST